MKTRENILLHWARKYSFRARMDKAGFTGLIFERAKYTLVYDVNAKEYKDFNSEQMCSALGHNHPRVIDAYRGIGP